MPLAVATRSYVPPFPAQDLYLCRQAKLEVRWMKYCLMQNARERCGKSSHLAEKRGMWNEWVPELEPICRETQGMPLGPPRETDLQLTFLHGYRPVTVATADGNPAMRATRALQGWRPHLRTEQRAAGLLLNPGPPSPCCSYGHGFSLTPVLALPSPLLTSLALLHLPLAPRPSLLRSSCPARFACAMAANGGHRGRCHGPEGVAEGAGNTPGASPAAPGRAALQGRGELKRAVCNGDTGRRPVAAARGGGS